MIRPPTRSTLFPTRRSSDLQRSNGQESELLDKIKSIENEIKSLRNLSFANIIRQSKKIDDLKVLDRKSTRLNSSHVRISYAVFCLKKKKKKNITINYINKNN